MREKIKNLISFLIAINLIFTLIVPAFSVDGDGKVMPEKIEICEATDEDLKEMNVFVKDLITTVAYKGSWINNEVLKYDFCIENYVANPSGYFPMYENYFRRIDIADKKALSEIPFEVKNGIVKDDSYFYVYKKDNIDWIFHNIFNMPYSRFLWFNPKDLKGDNFFYYDGNYYVLKNDEEKRKEIKPDIMSVEKAESGKYVLGLNYYLEKKTYYKYMVLALKDFGVKKMWTVYFMGAKDGVYEASLKDGMQMYVDSNSFSNSSTDFLSVADRTRYYMEKAYINKLTENKNLNVKNLVCEQMIGGWRGAGYGIGAVMGLYYDGRYDKSTFKSSQSGNFADLSAPVNDITLRNLIDYNQLTQFTVDSSEYLFYDKLQSEDDEQIKNVLKKVIDIAKKDKPFLINCQWKNDKGIVANTFVCFRFVVTPEGDYRITAIDPDNKYSLINFIIDKDFTKCDFAESYYDDCNILSLGVQSFDSVSLSEENIAKGVHENRTIITFPRSNNLKIQNNVGQILTCEDGEISGDMPFVVENFIANGSNYLSDVMISVENSKSFVVTTDEEMFDMTISGNNGVFCGVEGNNINKLYVTNEDLTIDGNNMAYSVSVKSNEEEINMVNVRGGESKTLNVNFSDDVTFKSERRQNVRIALLYNSGEMEECDYLPQDFDYIVNGKLVSEKIEDSKNDHIKVLIFFMAFGGIMAVVAVVVVYLIMKKRIDEMKKQLQNKNNE